jgi:hypothetical protein
MPHSLSCRSSICHRRSTCEHIVAQVYAWQMLRDLGEVASLMQQESSLFVHNRNSSILPWLLQERKTCKKLKTEIKIRKVGLSRQDVPAFDHKSVKKMHPLWGFSTVSLGVVYCVFRPQRNRC